MIQTEDDTHGGCYGEDDLKIVEKDEGFCKVLRRIDLKGLTLQQRKAQERCWRKKQQRSVFSPSAFFRYLKPSMIPKGKRSSEAAGA